MSLAGLNRDMGQATKNWAGGQLNERPISRISDEAENGRPTADYKHAKGARSRQDPARQIRKLCVTGSSSAFPPKTPISAAMRTSVHAESRSSAVADAGCWIGSGSASRAAAE